MQLASPAHLSMLDWIVFTNIKILGERAILAEAANLLSITKSNVKLIIVGADGVLTFDKN